MATSNVVVQMAARVGAPRHSRPARRRRRTGHLQRAGLQQGHSVGPTALQRLPGGRLINQGQTQYAWPRCGPEKAWLVTGSEELGATERNRVLDCAIAFCVMALTLSSLLVTVPVLSVDISVEPRPADTGYLAVVLV